MRTTTTLDPTATSWDFPSSSSSATHTTKRHADGSLSCSCSGWRFKKAHADRGCTHTNRVTAALGTPSAPGPVTVAARASVLAATPAAKPTFAPFASPLDMIDFADPAPLGDAPAPMLASAMTDPVTGAAFDARFASGWVMEEKIDGHRMVVTVTTGLVTAESRAGNARTLDPAMRAQLAHFPDGIYDGELVGAGGKSWDVTSDGPKVLVLFDIADAATRPLPYTARRAKLLTVLGTCLTPGQQSVTTVESVPPTWAGYLAIRARGGEGIILKRLASTYRPGHRSPDWVKVKAKLAAVLTITGFKAGKSGPYSAVKLLDAAGIETTVKTLDVATLRAIEKDPTSYIARRLVISFQEKTPDGSYRHPMWDHLAGIGE